MNRSPLNPCDYLLLMMDEAMRREGLAGNTCVALLRMEDPPDVRELEAYARSLAEAHPFLDGRLEFSLLLRRARWRHPVGAGIPVEKAREAGDLLNLPMDPRRDAPVALYGLPEGVAVRWHHALMDARGCERLLAGETSDVPKGREFEADLGRRSWWRRFRSALRMRRLLRETDARRPALFRHGAKEGSKSFAVRMESFDEAETKAIFGRAGDLCGPLQANLYFLAAVFRAAEPLCDGPGPMVIPVPADLRKKEWSPVAANHLTFFHFEVAREAAGEMRAVAAHLKRSHLDQIRRGDDAAMVALMHMGRRLGLGRYLRERVSRDGRERTTLYFSYPGESKLTSFLGRPVLEYRAFPAVQARPGVGVLFSVSGGRLLLTVVWVRENVEGARIDEFVARLREGL